MNILVCDGSVSSGPGGEVICSGTLSSVAYNEGITTEDATALTDSALLLFAIVFGFLALKKALM